MLFDILPRHLQQQDLALAGHQLQRQRQDLVLFVLDFFFVGELFRSLLYTILSFDRSVPSKYLYCTALIRTALLR